MNAFYKCAVLRFNWLLYSIVRCFFYRLYFFVYKKLKHTLQLWVNLLFWHFFILHRKDWFLFIFFTNFDFFWSVNYLNDVWDRFNNLSKRVLFIIHKAVHWKWHKVQTYNNVTWILFYSTRRDNIIAYYFKNKKYSDVAGFKDNTQKIFYSIYKKDFHQNWDARF